MITPSFSTESFVEDGKEIDQNLHCTCRVIIFPNHRLSDSLFSWVLGAVAVIVS